MNRRQRIIVSLTGIFLVLLILMGLTYAYFSTRINGNESSKSFFVSTANLSLIYEDGNGMIEPDGLIVPGTTIGSKTFTVKNKGNETSTYSIVLKDIVNTLERNQDLVFTLTRNGTLITEGLDLNHIAAGGHQIILPSVSIEEGETDEYIFSLEYKEAGVDQSKDMNSKLEFKIDIETEKTTWNNSKDGTLLYALKNNQPSGDVNISLEAIEWPTSLSGEQTIVSSEDDYGISYIYKGAVINNYVNYSGMCWRILRVQGDGTIKLILADENNECDSPLHSIENINSAFINGMSEDFYSNIIDLEHYYYENSNIPSILLKWMDKAATNSDGKIIREKNLDTSKLILTDWCNDFSIVSESGYGIDESGNYVYTKEEATKEWWPTYSYGASERLLKEESSPTLKCNMKGINDSKAIRYESNVGILTADEIAIADGISDSVPSSYLFINAMSVGFTMTPYDYQTMNSSEMFVLQQGSLAKRNNTEMLFFRPVIVLTSDVLVEYDTDSQYEPGTYQNPYKIK